MVVVRKSAFAPFILSPEATNFTTMHVLDYLRNFNVCVFRYSHDLFPLLKRLVEKCDSIAGCQDEPDVIREDVKTLLRQGLNSFEVRLSEGFCVF